MCLAVRHSLHLGTLGALDLRVYSPQEQKRLQDEKNRERARSAGINGGELKGELSKKLKSHNVVGLMTPLDVKVLQTYPNRDW
jgi:hypothetical protein